VRVFLGGGGGGEGKGGVGWGEGGEEGRCTGQFDGRILTLRAIQGGEGGGRNRIARWRILKIR